MRDRIKELGLLSQPLSDPIDRQLVAQVRAFVKGSSVAQAAAAVSVHGNDLEAACEHVRGELGLPQPEAPPDAPPARDLNDDALLRGEPSASTTLPTLPTLIRSNLRPPHTTRHPPPSLRLTTVARRASKATESSLVGACAQDDCSRSRLVP